METMRKLVVAYMEWIHKKARHYYDDRCKAEDLAGETIYKLLKSASSFNPERNFKAWTLAIMANTFKTQCRPSKRITSMCLPLCEEYLIADDIDGLASVNMLLRLYRKYRKKSCYIESVVLYAKGYSYTEIATMSNISVTTARSRVCFGRKMLREALEM